MTIFILNEKYCASVASKKKETTKRQRRQRLGWWWFPNLSGTTDLGRYSINFVSIMY